MTEETYLIDDREVVITQSWAVRCDGNGLSGHPVEYITLAPKGQAACKYCGRRFVHASTPEAERIRAEGQRAAA
ncbi:MAG: zinc-finger domain-containing protein [Geminicoccaceae bacterium]|nr:zinc-finger domain-containing protein [Geminicoccaceae bacterium]MCX7629103.1 zinc-finger domain-containing protein [Geminicoccaceae bacterium]MDW8124885.1 zinc-finger domain-containing protein [Geminicoccaceae bacterium]MDW8342404.1 zinc-finger domain-containing protein [Geminicoccaceae bacterium]